MNISVTMFGCVSTRSAALGGDVSSCAQIWWYWSYNRQALPPWPWPYRVGLGHKFKAEILADWHAAGYKEFTFYLR